jgi:protein LTV1
MENPDDCDEFPDDFVTQAAAVGETETADFDFDAHIRKLMGEGGDEDDSDEDDMPELEDEKWVDDSSDGRLRKEMREQVEAQLEQVLDEYDETEVGELDEYDDRLQGHMDTENPLLDTALDEYLESACKIEYSDALGWGTKLEPKDKQMGQDYAPGKIKATLMRNGDWHGKDKQQMRRIVQTKRLEAQRKREEEDAVKLAEEAKAAVGAVGGEKKNPMGNAKEDEIDLTKGVTFDKEKYQSELEQANPYLAPVEKDKWDCETIVSTYSNLDNHPSIIDMPVNRKKKSTTGSMMSSMSYTDNAPSVITLSAKTGMPVGVLASSSALDSTPALAEVEEEEEEEEEEEGVLENKGAARPKKETKEDKKARKQAIKDEKQVGISSIYQ